MDIIIPDIEHKYITLFETQQGYDTAAPNFIEVNWSAVKDTEHPEEIQTPYQPSTRPTHGYEPVDNVDVFPDSSVRMLWYTYDHIYKTFFLEIIWGYSGWEWVDYEYTDPDTQETTTLHGGNLYKVKEITTVPTIPDGYRLEHINNFLNSQDKVTHVEWFDTSNIKSMKNAFKNSLVSRPFQIDCYKFPNVTEIDGAFQNKRLKIINDETLTFNRVTNALTAFNKMSLGYNNLPIPKINMPALTTAKDLLKEIYIYKDLAELNLNEMFVGDTLNNSTSFVSLLESATRNTSGNTPTTDFIVKIDLTGTNINNSEILDLSSFCKLFDNGSKILTLDIKTNNPLNLNSVFQTGKTSTNKYRILDLNNKEALVRSIKYGFNNNVWDSNHVFPYTQPLNETVNDSWEFESAIFRDSINYDFSPNHTLKMTYGHFSNASFYGASNNFSNVEYLNTIIFDFKAGFTTLPYNLWDSNITYANPGVQNLTNAKYIDFARFKYIKLGGSVTQIPSQTIYTSCREIFSSSMLLDNSINVHIAQNGVYMQKNSNQTDLFSLSSVVFQLENNNMITAPTIYFHALDTGGNYYADYEFITSGTMSISGTSLTTITIHIVNESTDALPPFVNLSFSGANLEYIIIDGDDYRCTRDWDIIKCPNLDMTTFAATLMRRQVGHYSAYYSRPVLRLTLTQWQALELIPGVEAHCREIFSKITTDQEVDL